MNLPEYVSKAEVQRVCQELGLQDWTQLTEAKIPLAEARIIQAEVGEDALLIDADQFQKGLEVELEHGVQFSDANVTNNHPLLTGMIVLAHLKEMLDYYMRLDVAELQGDLLKALLANNPEKMAMKYQQLLVAQADLSEYEKTLSG